MRILPCLAVLGLLLPSAGAATTITKIWVYDVSSGPLAGETLTLSYTYPRNGPDQPIFSYDPPFEATAASARAGVTSSGSGGSLVFSDSGDILEPEPFVTFDFGANPAGLIGITNFANQVTYLFEDGPDADISCGAEGVTCRVTVEAVPLPPALPMLLAGLAGAGVLLRKRPA